MIKRISLNYNSRILVNKINEIVDRLNGLIVEEEFWRKKKEKK